MMRGSMSVFLGMVLTMVMSLFFSMTEVTRYFCISKEADSSTTLAVQNLFGEYLRPLWEDYGILAIDASYGEDEDTTEPMEGRLQSYYGGNCPDENMEGVDLLQVSMAQCNIYNRVFLTDNEGAPFVKEAATFEKTEIPEDVLENLLGISRQSSESTASDFPIRDLITNNESLLPDQGGPPAISGSSSYKGYDRAGPALPAEASSKSSLPADPFSGSTEYGEVEQATENDLAHQKNMAVLSQVLEEPESVSHLGFMVEERVSERPLLKGDGYSENANLTEGALFRYYLSQHFGSFRKDLKHEGLKYEQEYILCGEETDEDNLTETVVRLLALREVENVLSMRAGAKKMTQVHGVAAASSAVIANPELEEVVCVALIAAWAYLESVLDVRLLLSGGKVSMVKTPQEWTSDLASIFSSLSVSVKAKDCPAGLDYSAFLFALFSLEGQKKLAFRALDLMEDALRHVEGCANVCMDRMLVSADFDMTMTATPLFLSFIPLMTGRLSDYEYEKEKRMSYL